MQNRKIFERQRQGHYPARCPLRPCTRTNPFCFGSADASRAREASSSRAMPVILAACRLIRAGPHQARQPAMTPLGQKLGSKDVSRQARRSCGRSIRRLGCGSQSDATDRRDPSRTPFCVKRGERWLGSVVGSILGGSSAGASRSVSGLGGVLAVAIVRSTRS